jgi:hypothetical protein
MRTTTNLCTFVKLLRYFILWRKYYVVRSEISGSQGGEQEDDRLLSSGILRRVVS